MKGRTIIIAGSFAQCSLAVLGLTAAVVGVIAAFGCLVEIVTAGIASERQD